MQNAEDFAAIQLVLKVYMEGLVWGDTAKLLQAFHPKATAFGHVAGAFEYERREAFAQSWKALAILTDGDAFPSAVISIDVTGDIATAKVTNTCFGDDYTDYLTLIKDTDRWQIIAKAFYVHPVERKAK